MAKGTMRSPFFFILKNMPHLIVVVLVLLKQKPHLNIKKDIGYPLKRN